jgi:translation initiation factor IF-3
VSSAEANLKEINFHLSISQHDYAVKMRHAEEFLWNGIKVRLQLKFRGVEMLRQEEGMALIRRMNSDLSGTGIADAEPRLAGKSIRLMINPLSPDKRVRKFLV